MEQNIYSLEAHFLTYPPHIKMAILVILLSVAMVISTNLSLLFRRMRASIIQSKVSQVKTRLTEDLADSLSSTDLENEQPQKRLSTRFRRSYLQDSRNTQLLVDELIFFKRNFSDTIGNVVYAVYGNLDLIQRSLRKLETRSFAAQAEGLRELQEMPPDISDNEAINPFLDHDNDDLRVEAQAAYLTLNPDNPFEFLKTTTHPLMDWHQIVLFETIINTPDMNVPDFSTLLNHEQPTVITFAIKLIEHFHQFESIPKLIDVLGHISVKVKLAAIHALAKLDAEESEVALSRIYPDQEIQTKIAILDTIGKIGSGNELRFLKNQFLMADNFEVIKAASCALVNYPGFEDKNFLTNIPALTPTHEEIMKFCVVEYSNN